MAFAGDAPAASNASSPSVPLPELPKLPAVTYPEPDPASLKDLDRILERLSASEEKSRESARTALTEATPALVPAIRHRIQELRTVIDRDEAPRMLEDARKTGRKALKAKGDGKPKEKEKSKDKKKDEDDASDGDWLEFLLAKPAARDKNWQDLVHLLGMVRMLTAIGTTPAVRELVQLHAYFGDMLRIDLQRQIAKLKDKAVPALIEARNHDAKVVQKWANKELDALGKAIPGEAVGTNDTQVLADVLRAYGRTRDVDAERVILSFCNSERVQLRDAGREAIAAIGEPGIWQLRDQYLGLTGAKPPRDWTWDRIARELFLVWDRQRLAELDKLMEEGVGLAKDKRLAEAVEAFDKVLARSPLFERKREMVPTYAAYGRSLESDKRDVALDVLRKAIRLDPKSESIKSIEAEVSYLDGLASIDRGAPDRFLFQRALELDPTNERAKAALASLQDKAVVRQESSKRYLIAGGIALAALAAMILLARRKPKADTTFAAPLQAVGASIDASSNVPPAESLAPETPNPSPPGKGEEG
jgi:tetratricopeptide (TPR) repeat protein